MQGWGRGRVGATEPHRSAGDGQHARALTHGAPQHCSLS